MTKIFVFPGQGSQVKGMGAELFDLFPEEVKIADQILGYSLKQLCLEDPANNLGNTAYTQPALFSVNALTYYKKIQESGKPDFVAGHSLGEYNALLAAGAFDFATGLQLVQRRGAIMSKATGGGMAAVIGLTTENIHSVLNLNGLNTLDIANYNSPTQTVISGPQQDIIAAQPLFEQAGAKLYVVLKVSGAFHSRYMQDAQKEFEHFLAQHPLKPLQLPVIANYSAQPYTDADAQKSLASQISSSVRWVESIQYLKNQPAPEFFEIGPGKVLTKLIAQIK